MERERQGCRERFGVEARSARSRAMFFSLLAGLVGRGFAEMNGLVASSDSDHTRNREPRKKHLTHHRLSPLSSPSSIYSIHGGKIHIFFLFHVFSSINVSHSSPLLFTTPSPGGIVSELTLSIRHWFFLTLCSSRTGVFVTTIFAGAFAFGVGFDVGVTNLWDSWNRGVR